MTKNEGAACEAVVRLFENRLGARRGKVRRPDSEFDCPSTARVDYLVDVGSAGLALEHTLIEAFGAQVQDDVRFTAFVGPIEEAFSTGLPGKFQLLIDPGALAGVPGPKIAGVRAAVMDWIRRAAPLLDDTPPQHYLSTRPPGVPFDVGLYRWKVSWPTCLMAGRGMPLDLEKQRADRIGRALTAKIPKLREWEKHGAKSVLIFENRDIALSNHVVIMEALYQVAPAAEQRPDYLVLVETYTPTWDLFLLIVDRQFSNDINIPFSVEPGDLQDL